MSSDQSSNATQGIRDLVSGMTAGMVGKIVEFPFDTVKVRLQTQVPQAGNFYYNGPIDCFVKIFRDEGIKGYYKGMTTPLLGAMAENAVLFTINGQMQTFLKGKSNRKLHIYEHFFCGAVAGLFVSFVLTPVELVKCRLQIQQGINSGPARYSGPIDVVKQTIKEAGFFGMFKGHSATLFREIIGNAVWFGCYESTCHAMIPEGKTKDSLQAYQLICAGALSGCVYWGIPYPTDVIKSKMQTVNQQQVLEIRNILGITSTSKSMELSFSDVFRFIIKTQGFKGLYKGLAVTLCRAVPANAAIFYVYELVSRNLKLYTHNNN
eukprot:TRINITY_DN5336_c0_g2_i1.p1 TRINITY_DN5336_c0_g2~~TRINITY_DN5336_c0_g2_i1.p1  ORF type:complete len:321 (+),score=119.37 TRINITY_DN5336_c0_g2_i1:115-1077(+)